MGDGKFQETCVWRLLGFDFGGSKYGFEVAREGGTANLVINGRVAQRLPLAVWRALADAIALQREDKPERVGRPERAGDAWSKEEDEIILLAHTQQRPIDEVATELRRSRGAIRTRYEKLGVYGPATTRQGTTPSVEMGSAAHPVTYLQPKEPSRPFRAA